MSIISTNRPIEVLLVEDHPGDARLIQELLNESAGAFHPAWVRQLAAGLAGLAAGQADVALLDLGLPDSQGLNTFIRAHHQFPQTPIVVLTGLDDEDLAAQAVRLGAQDYLVKGQTDGRLLARAIRYAIERKQLAVERERLIAELQEAVANIKTLRGLLPICAYCKKIRDDQGYWNQLEAYVRAHTEADFTHSICPDCMAKLQAQYPQYFREIGVEKPMDVPPAEILLVEDNPGDVRLIQEALQESAGRSRLHVARDGTAALAFLRRQGADATMPRPDLILLDLNLPQKSGLEVLAEIKADVSLRRIPVVILTTSEAEEDIRASYDRHANCYITKPSDWDQFLRVIRSLEEFWLTVARRPAR